MQRKTSHHKIHRRSRPIALTGQQRRVLEYIELRGVHGATDVEIQKALRLRGDTQRPRRRELEQAGLIREAVQHREGCKVWVFVDGVRDTAGRQPARHIVQRTLQVVATETERPGPADLNETFGPMLDALTETEVLELIGDVPDDTRREGLRKRFERLGRDSGFVRPWLLRLLAQQPALRDAG